MSRSEHGGRHPYRIIILTITKEPNDAVAKIVCDFICFAFHRALSARANNYPAATRPASPRSAGGLARRLPHASGTRSTLLQMIKIDMSLQNPAPASLVPPVQGSSLDTATLGDAYELKKK